MYNKLRLKRHSENHIYENGQTNEAEKKPNKKLRKLPKYYVMTTTFS